MVVSGIYRVVRLLGVGGMGEVWEARHERTKGRVALKLLLPDMGRHSDVLQRFQREVEITSGLNHPNIVRVSDADKLPDGRPFLVMEFLDGHDLAHFIGRPMPLAEVIEIIEQTALGLHAAHGHGVIHRDLKPANIFLVPLPGTSRSLVKILDFGISKAVDRLSKLTQTRTLMGTPYYMAPEQATGGGAAMDARADQFSLAAIAYEMVTGRMAFEGDGMANVLYKVVNEAPPTFASLGIDPLPLPAVEAAVMRGLSKSANDRFATVLEFSDAVKRAGNSATLAERRAPAALARRTSILPPGPVATTTLSTSTGQMDVVEETEDSQDSQNSQNSQDDEEVFRGPRAFRRRSIALGAGGVAIGVAVMVMVLLRGSAVAPKTNPTSGGPSLPAAAPVVPAFAPPPAQPLKEPTAAEPTTAAQAEPVPTVVRSPGPVAASSRRAKAKAAAKAVPSEPRTPARHPGPLNDDL
jgi:serine/threonine protein kinase